MMASARVWIVPSWRGLEVRWARFWVLMLAGTMVVALATGVPTVLIPNGWFTRMTPVEAYARPVWIAASLLSGLLLAVSASVRDRSCPPMGCAAGGAGLVLSWLAVGCPICNKLVVGLLGVGGALGYFAPAQPWLAAVSLLLLAGALVWRLCALRAGWRGHGRPDALAAQDRP